MPKIKRNTSTPEQKELWRSAERASEQIETWPDWKTGVKDGNKKAMEVLSSFGWSLDGAPTIRVVARLLSDINAQLKSAIEIRSMSDQRRCLKKLQDLRLALEAWENNRP